MSDCACAKCNIDLGINALPSFPEFPSIPRLSREMIVTEKIDGTNASIYIPDDRSFIQAGSRTKWITPADDNAGFAKWVEANKEDLLENLGPGHHFGEWWGKGIGRGYGLSEKRFSLFNTTRWAATKPICCQVVPVIHTGIFDTSTIDYFLTLLQKKGSMAAPGFMQPEGVVVFHVKGNLMFKKTLDSHDQHKGQVSA